MTKNILIIVVGILTGLAIGFLINFYSSSLPAQVTKPLEKIEVLPQKEVIGFLPYWLLDKANKDYSNTITTLSYFGVTVDTDGHILKLSNPQEEEPGWHALESGKIGPFLEQAKKNKQNLSLVAFMGNSDMIEKLIEDPGTHAQNLIADIVPIMQKYGFSSLNLDIEYTKETTNEQKAAFTQFVQQLKSGLDSARAGSLTIDVASTSFLGKSLTSVADVAPFAKSIIVMDYDFHFTGSNVSGPVAPLSGAGQISEYDTQESIKAALNTIPAAKIILGMPLYGYEWETIGNFSRAATIPGTGVIASNQRVENLLRSCSACNVQIEDAAKEQEVIFKDQQNGVYHQIFYPDKNATSLKIDFAKENKLAGVALWALGYEGSTILGPVKDYK
jgi:spore germination protein